MSEPRRTLGYRFIWRACAMIGVPYFRPRVEGLPNVHLERPFIVACNHSTLLDWAALAYFIPRPVRFLITRAYYDRPVLRWFCRLGGAIAVTPGRIEPSALRRALAALRSGDVVAVFPEGRISPDGHPLPARRGIVELAIRSGAPIVPATIRGAARAFPPTARLPRPYSVTVAFGTPIVAPAHASRGAQDAFANALMQQICALQHRASTVATNDQRRSRTPVKIPAPHSRWRERMLRVPALRRKVTSWDTATNSTAG